MRRGKKKKSSLFPLHGRHPFYMSPFLNQEILHELINLPVGSTPPDIVIAESQDQSSRKKSTKNRGNPPVGEHPKPKVPHFLLRQHIQQMRRIQEMHVVVSAPMSEQVIHVVEPRNVGYRRVYIPTGVDVGEVHVPFSVDGVWTPRHHTKGENEGYQTLLQI